MQKDLPNAKTGETIVHALEIYIKAMKDTRSYFPEQLSQALQSVKSAPLFRSAELHSMIELNLDVYGQFIDDDIKMFVPYIRHDELQKLESERILKKWAKQAFSSFLSRLQTQLATIIDPLDVMQLRTNVVQQWLSTSQRSVGIDSLEVLDGLRGTFNSHLVTMVQSQITSLSRASSIINNRLLNWENGNPQPHTSLWDISMISMDFSNGANIFIESILTRFDGKDEDLRQFLTEYEGWLRRVANIEQMLKNMRENKWDDSADDFDNNDDTLDNKQILLCEDDPLFLQDKFQTALEFSLSKFESMIQTQSVRDNGLSDGQKAVYLLRICRESMKRLPLGYRKADFGLESVSNLHETVAILAIEGPLNICKRRIKRTRKNRQALGRPLWEGDPALPVLPSSWVFRLLHDIVSSMKTLGRDLWSLQAVKVLKKHLRLQLAAELQLPAPFAPSATQLNGDVITERDRENLELGNGEEDTTAKNPENATNGELNVSISDVSSNDSKIQRFFDIVYLTHSTKQKEVLENDVDDLDNVKNSIQEDLNLEVGPKRRMLRDAEEYWRRTSMLFALIT